MRAPPVSPAAWYRTESQDGTFRLIIGGRWVRSEARRLDPVLRTLDAGRNAKAVFDCGAIERLDTVGAWLLLRTKRSLERRGLTVQPVHVDPRYRALVHTIDHDC